LFEGYCACWSGAFGRSCIMDSAVPGTATFPDPPSVINDAWDASTLEIQQVYFGLNYTLMANRNFYRNWTNHPTCPNLANWQQDLIYLLEVLFP